jgi:hypothetical protein
MIARRRFLALAVGAGSHSQAQPEDILAVRQARAARLLDSETLNLRAWGAYFAAELQITGVLPRVSHLLREAVRNKDGHRDNRYRAYVGNLVDAAIQLRADLPLGVLAELSETRLAETLILLRHGEINRDHVSLLLRLLERLKATKYYAMPEWVAVNNFLQIRRPSTWVVRLLRETTVRYVITVVDSPGPGPHVHKKGGAGTVVRNARPPDMFPPVIEYHLTFVKPAGDSRVAEGPLDVHFCRIESNPDKPAEARGLGFAMSEQDLRLKYLQRLVDVGTELRTVFEPRVTVEWQSAAALEESIARETALQIESIREFARRLARSGITGLEGLQLQVLIEIADSRQSREVPLPAVPPRTFTLP